MRLRSKGGFFPCVAFSMALVAGLPACSTEAPPPVDPAYPVANATTITGVLRNVRVVLDKSLLFQRSSYTDDRVKALFGGKEILYTFVSDGKPAPFARYYVSDFSGLETLTETPNASIPSIQASISVVPFDGQEHGAIRQASVLLALNVEFPDEKLDVEHVRTVLGAPLLEDKDMEAREFRAATSELFNRDANAADQGQVYVSDARVGSIESKFVLHFNAKGSLYGLMLTQSKGAP